MDTRELEQIYYDVCFQYLELAFQAAVSSLPEGLIEDISQMSYFLTENIDDYGKEVKHFLSGMAIAKADPENAMEVYNDSHKVDLDEIFKTCVQKIKDKELH